MKTSRLRLVGACCLTVLTAGCLEIEETLTLDRDGSGKVDLELTLPVQTAPQLERMLALTRDLGQGTTPPPSSHDYFSLLVNPSEKRIQAYISEHAPTGVTLQKVTVSTARDGNQSIRLILAFPDIDTLNRTAFFGDQGFSLTQLPDGNYRFARRTGHPMELPNLDMSDPAFHRRMTPLMGGFKGGISLRAPTRIIRANSSRRSSRQVRWAFEFDRDPTALRGFFHQDLEAVLDGSGMTAR